MKGVITKLLLFERAREHQVNHDQSRFLFDACDRRRLIGGVHGISKRDRARYNERSSESNQGAKRQQPDTGKHF